MICDPTTRHHIELRVQRHILPALGHHRLDVLTRSPSIIQAWAANLPVSPSYAQQLLAEAIFATAVRSAPDGPTAAQPGEEGR